ncbi:DUF3084 domain-containing protein [Trichocoleus sp. FACHB-262]|uniref:DUF3084 domain-containing protein n=1 Tax=Trichocoleus sp. FACHB-262 TaxID=2692869 RepID=UPI001686BD41|nr:DUF3084 domain-containing protein [Trichocoleus sp. FACHB-262]MBD2123047.1 DUF3084 domain-containing protein [Trichocoleus sp. FACHB-262]
MTSGYILIVAILVLGGVIATVGDRIGTRVGKARLSLFNLRPRKTAVLVTIVTGGIISASTLAILFAVSDQLRTGVFELGKIQKNLSRAREDLAKTRFQKNQVEQELTQARAEQVSAQQRLDRINLFLKAAIAKQATTETQLNRTQTQLGRVEAERARTEAQLDQTQSQLSRAEAEKDRIEDAKDRTEAELNRTQTQLSTVSQQATGLRSEIDRLDNERQNLIKETKDLEVQQANLEKAVQTLQRYYQYYQAQYETLRQGNVALFRGQVLSAGVVRIVSPTGAQQAVDQLLREANRNAIKLTRPGAGQVSEQIIQITRPEVEQLVDQIEDGRDYVIRILSAGNYVLGEKSVQVVASATFNQVAFLSGDVIAAASVDPSILTEADIQKRIELLLAATEFRARGAGVLTEGVQIAANGPSVTAILSFAEQLKQYRQPLDLKVVTTGVIYTAGPLKVELLAIQNGQVVLSTSRDIPQPNRPQPNSSPSPQPNNATPNPNNPNNSVTQEDANFEFQHSDPYPGKAPNSKPSDVSPSPFVSPDDL